MASGRGGAEGDSQPVDTTQVEKFEEAFTNCLTTLTKEDNLTNIDRDEIRVDVEQGLQKMMEAARTMEAYFIKKRMEISAQKPELLVKDDTNELKLEIVRKDELLKKNYEKISHWQSILSEVHPVGMAVGKPGVPPQQQSMNGPGSHVQGGPLSQGPQGGPLSQGPQGGPLSQGPHTPLSQGPMTPTGGRPQTPASVGPRVQSDEKKKEGRTRTPRKKGNVTDSKPKVTRNRRKK